MFLVLETITFLSSALCIGGMVFFAIVVAPMVFIHLDDKNAGKLIRAIFPWYYLYVIITAIIPAVVYGYQSSIAGLGFFLAVKTALYARQILMNKINKARDAMISEEEGAEQRFKKLHKLSVRLNAVGLIAVFVSIIYIGSSTS